MPEISPGETAYIALGSNLDNPLQQVLRAISAIDALPHTRICKQSRWYQSSAIGPGDQPDYINGVVKVITALAPHDLLCALQEIETAQGRTRQQRWSARTLDLDILLYGEQVLQTEQLTLPHPEIANRGFVLLPLTDVEPALVMPAGTPLARLLENCSAEGIVVLSEGE